MNIQSLSIVVPTKKCVNNCPFCVSKTHDNDYENQSCNPRFEENYIERLEFAKDNGTNTIILTGTGEALQNKKFLRKFAEWNKKLHKSFYIIELQTTGVFLDNETLSFLRDEIKVKTISLSVSDLFDDENNLNIIGVAKHLNKNGWYPEYGYIAGEPGTQTGYGIGLGGAAPQIMRVSKKVRRFGFQSLEFLDIDDLPQSTPVELVAVEKMVV